MAVLPSLPVPAAAWAVGVAEALARQGATVAVNDFYADRAESVAAELRAQGYKALAAPADVTDYDAVKAMIAKVREQVGIVDIYVSNAGVPTSGMGYAKFLESTPADWERFVKLNMYGLMNGAHAVLPGMLEKGWGRIVAITSESWRAGVPMGIAAYAASKAGVVGFIRQLAAETGRKNITVNALSLGTMNNWEGSDELATPDRLRSPRRLAGRCRRRRGLPGLPRSKLGNRPGFIRSTAVY